MIKIKPFGYYHETDKLGFIVNCSNADKISFPWKEALSDVIRVYKEHLGNMIHSVYVRGSVAKGLAIPNLSDIDTLAVIKVNLQDMESKFLEEKAKSLEDKYPFSINITLQYVFYNYLVSTSPLYYSNLGFNQQFSLKTQCCCIYGQDLIPSIPPFKADFYTASMLARDMVDIFYQAKIALKDINNSSESLEVRTIAIQSWCRWIMKFIIRNGFILVMDIEKVFTRDLYPSYISFIKYYTEKKHCMKRSLYWALNPTSDIEKIYKHIDTFGIWLQQQLEEKFLSTNNLE